MRTIAYKEIPDSNTFTQQLLGWAQAFREVQFLDSNAASNPSANFDALLAVDAFTSLKTDSFNAFEDIKQYQEKTGDWLFGYFSYDLKNDTEALQSNNHDQLDFPDLFFFQPKKLFLLKGGILEMHYLRFCEDEMEPDWDDILAFEVPAMPSSPIAMQPRISKENYLAKVEELLQHLHRGDLYEANFCMEFYSEQAVLHPLEKYLKLNAISKPPFAAFFKNHRHYVLSASPERYLRKEGSTLISQPIKGTAKRFSNEAEDERSKQNLASDPKERAENIMITDLVRNDLSKTAEIGSVKVAELCGIYSFLQVHQMISTITSTLDPNYTVIDAIKTTFPMGSMTGAPKIAAMKLMESQEETKRGLYSGALGYFTPTNDFDFNVVIRSILYNEEQNYVSFSVGSAITALSDPEKEYEECQLKAKALFEVLA